MNPELQSKLKIPSLQEIKDELARLKTLYDEAEERFTRESSELLKDIEVLQSLGESFEFCPTSGESQQTKGRTISRLQPG